MSPCSHVVSVVPASEKGPVQTDLLLPHNSHIILLGEHSYVTLPVPVQFVHVETVVPGQDDVVQSSVAPEHFVFALCFSLVVVALPSLTSIYQ